MAEILLAMLVVGSFIAMAANTCPACTNTKEDKEELKLPEELTKEDLQKLYNKYNITENDIKFAEGKLPYFLKGTILDGKVVTMGKVTKDGKVENWIDPLFYKWCIKNGYKVIPTKKALEVEEKARENYIKKYGVDPANPKIDVINGVPLPKEYVKELVKSGKLTPGSGSSNCPATVTPEGARAVNGNLYLWIAEAGDPQHKPSEAYLQDTVDGYGRFYQFGVDLYYYKYYNYWCWDASDVSPSDDANELLEDLAQDTNWVRDDFNDKNPTNDIVIGWVKYADHNGMAYCDGFFSLAATEAAGVDWPHDSIAQHEISHNFNAPDHGYYCQVCIMCYPWAAAGTDIWCPEVCKPVIDGNINYQG